MNLKRNLLVIALFFMSLIILQAWEKDKTIYSPKQNMQTLTISKSKKDIQNIEAIAQEKRITITTDVLQLTINIHGGDIEQAFLLAYPEGTKSNKPFQLLKTTPEFTYQARSGLVGRDGLDNLEKNLRPLFNVKKNSFVLEDDQSEVTVPMVYTDAIGNTFIKTFILKRGEYVVKVNYKIQNLGKKPLEFSMLGQLDQSVYFPSYQDTKSSNFVLRTFRGAAYSTEKHKYKKYKFDTIINNKNLNTTSKGGWVAMLQQYFMIAWIPDKNRTHNFYTTNLGNNTVAISYQSEAILVQPGHDITLTSTLWVGPEIQDKMAIVAPNLDLTVDYGWLWFISQPLFKLLKFIHSFLGNWGFSIIVITFIVRVIMYPLTKAQYTSIAKLRLLQPKIQEIRKRLSNDKQQQSNEIITLYKEKKVNPLGGCFPLLIQMPIFLALYYMLIGSVELRCAPFALWIHDLSSQDPYYILPIFMGITMFCVQKMSPNSISDPTQQKVMIMMPIIFTAFFLWFPSGLVLYYIVSNLVTIVQQWFIYRGLEKRGLHN